MFFAVLKFLFSREFELKDISQLKLCPSVEELETKFKKQDVDEKGNREAAASQLGFLRHI